MNNAGQKPDSLGGQSTSAEVAEVGYLSGVGQDDLNRFDNRMSGKKGKRKDPKDKQPRQREQQRRDRQQRQRPRNEQDSRRGDNTANNNDNQINSEKGNE